ncbi:MAG: flagella basal body P-ring formation protein FlgA, partial [Gemmatimonadetes bacterium]|nr:flagella basal body P-ring formation protein FlgA [Gemmatimonadota bacterium]NIT66389.1 flagella basal body P-ring formation protein FlgA [Gemmatimonadota bacterium]NIW74800.1 flagella basal body P-ring formation protein FlgA [Gemmatimonadota bacterium]NIY34966.1 flagella basal body P-ring formation protein FlgA [Gemmatimonadota bacterium]
GIEIMTEGRALQRAAVGETIRVMNLSSRTTVSGQVAPDGSIQIIE